MDNVIEELRRMAQELNVTIILPKAPPLTEAEEARIASERAKFPRFIDYIGLIR